MPREGIRWAISIHESGHLLLAVLAGYECPEAHLLGLDGTPTREAHAELIGGYMISSFPHPESNERAGWRHAVMTAGGTAAERLVFGYALADAPGGNDPLPIKDAKSDIGVLIRLAGTFGGDDPQAWIEKAKAKASTVLALHYSQLLQTAERLCHGDKVGDGWPPLHNMKPRPELID